MVSEDKQILSLTKNLSGEEMLYEKIENGDLVAFGEISAADIIKHSVCQQDFVDLEPSSIRGANSPLKN